MLEARVAKLEAHTDHIRENVSTIKSDIGQIRKDMQNDFRYLLAAGATAVGVLAALIAHGFKWF